jgi:hypothetical protein
MHMIRTHISIIVQARKCLFATLLIDLETNNSQNNNQINEIHRLKKVSVLLFLRLIEHIVITVDLLTYKRKPAVEDIYYSQSANFIFESRLTFFRTNSTNVHLVVVFCHLSVPSSSQTKDDNANANIVH